MGSLSQQLHLRASRMELAPKRRLENVTLGKGPPIPPVPKQPADSKCWDCVQNSKALFPGQAVDPYGCPDTDTGREALTFCYCGIGNNKCTKSNGIWYCNAVR